MSVLDLVVPELEYLSNTLASVLDLEITIVDNSLKRLVGTGRLAAGVGKPAPRGSAFSQCMETGRHLFVEEPRRSPVCKNCSHRDQCTEEVEFCIPVRYNSKIVGVLGMCAFTEAT